MKLKDYLYNPIRRITAKSFAKGVGISEINVGRLARGQSIPSLKTALIIEKLTGGEVSVYDWIDEKEL